MKSDELYRMKQLMGLSTPKSFVSENHKKEIKSRIIIEALTGGKDELYKWIAKASGLSDETAEAFSKEASSFMKQSDQFAQVLAREGLDDVGKIQQKLSNAGYDVSNLDNAITMYFKQNPNVAKQVLMSMPEFTDNIIKNMSLETILAKRKDLIEPLKFVSGPEFKLETEDMVDDYQKLMEDIQKLADVSGGNQAIHNILNLMDIKIDTYNATKNVGSGTPTTKQVNSTSTAKETEPVKTNSETPKDVNKNVDTNIKWGNLGNGYQIANQITNYSGRYVVIVKEPSGRLRPFYQRTGGGGSDQGWASAGNWVPFYGIADVSIMTEKGLTRVDGWMIKPDNGRMGEVGDEKISQLLGDVVGTNGVKNADYEIGNFSKMMTSTPTPAALNDFLRAQGYEITPTNGALSKFQEPSVLHGIP